MADERLRRGERIRREVLGDEHVDRSLARASDFDREFQAFVTRTAWGDVWGRPGLERSTRSLLNIAMLAALGRMDEFRVHVRGALNNGCSAEQIREALIQVAVYAGMPAAMEGFRHARSVLADMEDQGGGDGGDGGEVR
ncbi:4-carboxymuconolactone decarboxylase [Arhodomonas sp. AD133]|uniref:4-carboxymuconolactone decarboxylase n=1 Tax=Arhodomonas sp. AD133 TaxID=3415009 RepID=UPI003EB8F1FD